MQGAAEMCFVAACKCFYRFLTKVNPKHLCLLPIYLSPYMFQNISDAINCWNCNPMDMY